MKNMRNSVRLIGNIGRDPELKTLPSGKCYVKLGLATTNGYQNAAKEWVKETMWHNITAWGSTAELMAKVLEKGSEVLIEGQLASRSYQDKDGQTKYTTEVIVDEFIALNRSKAEVSV